MAKNSKRLPVGEEDPVLAGFRAGLAAWASALEAHQLAPPDAGFAARLAGLAAAAAEQARIYNAAAPDYEWSPHSAGQPPHELRPDSGRRGPHGLWQDFDAAVKRLGAATEGRDMLAVARAYDDVAAIAAQLAQAIEREDRAAAAPPRTRARRSA
jgi:hypothetical protein